VRAAAGAQLACQRAALVQRQDAEDAAQETFVRMFRSLAAWDRCREFERRC
jgi:DNA-directed RNA polymerase specialized sigma24 family protein